MTPRFAYAAFMLAALLVFLVARRFTPRPPGFAKLSWQERVLLGLAALVGGTFGAKLPFVLFGDGQWLDLNSWLADGKTVTTGLIGAYLAVEVVKMVLGIQTKTGDAFAVPLALALGVGRWGCFFNGCCYGTPTNLPWGRDLLGDGIARHPTQIYEVIFHLSMVGVLIVVIRRGWWPGHRLQLYLIAYGVYRFLSEFIRPEPIVWLGLTFYQLAALVLVGGMALQWAWEERRLPPLAQAQPRTT
jgi:phosphatidylglycerol:prolipoprotein diacylglycerol transferase